MDISTQYFLQLQTGDCSLQINITNPRYILYEKLYCSDIFQKTVNLIIPYHCRYCRNELHSDDGLDCCRKIQSHSISSSRKDSEYWYQNKIKHRTSMAVFCMLSGKVFLMASLCFLDLGNWRRVNTSLLYSAQIPLPIVLDVQTFEGSDTVVPLAISVNVSVRACVESWSDDQALAFSYALLAILYIIPLLILIFLYSRIGYCMWKRRSVGERLNNNDQHSYNRRVRLVTLLVVLVALFAVLWGPYFVIQCLQLYKRPDYNPRVVGYLQMMGHANVAIDPVLYALFHQQIRKRMLIYVKRAKGFLCNWSIQLDSRVGAMSGTEQPEVDAVPDRGPNSALECQRNLQVIFSVDRNETVIGLTRTTKGSEDSIDSGRNGSIGSSLNLETYYTTTGVE